MRQANIPFYKKVAMELREDILEGVWAFGDILPSEAELMKRFEVSRITIRQALQLLELEGLIVRKQGKGTFIPDKKIEHDLSGIHDFARKMEKKGGKPSFRIEGLKIIEASKFIAEMLGLSEHEKVFRIERTKFENEEPLMFERIFLPFKYAPDLSIFEASDIWLSEFLRQRGLPVTRVKQLIQPILIEDYEAERLGVESRTLGLFVDRLSWSNSKIVLLTRAIARADKARFSVEVGSEELS